MEVSSKKIGIFSPVYADLLTPNTTFNFFDLVELVNEIFFQVDKERIVLTSKEYLNAINTFKYMLFFTINLAGMQAFFFFTLLKI